MTGTDWASSLPGGPIVTMPKRRQLRLHECQDWRITALVTAVQQDECGLRMLTMSTTSSPPGRCLTFTRLCRPRDQERQIGCYTVKPEHHHRPRARRLVPHLSGKESSTHGIADTGVPERQFRHGESPTSQRCQAGVEFERQGVGPVIGVHMMIASRPVRGLQRSPSVCIEGRKAPRAGVEI